MPSASVTGDHVTLYVRLSGRYVYSLSEQQLTTLRTQLAGMSHDQAATMLDHLAGVSQAHIQSSGTTLPSDPGRIHIFLSSP